MIEMGSVGWEHIGDTGRMGGDYRTIISILRPWLNDFAAKEPEHENRLSEDQKKHIISSLDGSCVQEDWDVLKARLPKLIRDLIMRTFLEVLVIKEIHTRFFENPFWYFDGKTGPLDQTGDDGFAVRMQYLYERYLGSKSLLRYTTYTFILIMYILCCSKQV